jgi:acyl-CoA hydrolase
VTHALGGKQGLGVHSGAIGDGIADLIEAGIVDNRHKEIDPGITVATMLMGTRRLYRFADRNPSIRIRATSYTHDALVLGNFRHFVAINGALEVDLTGQVNAETAAGRHVGLVGQMDFVRAANRAPQGRSIIALQSTNRDRIRSRIVARLTDGELPAKAILYVAHRLEQSQDQRKCGEFEGSAGAVARPLRALGFRVLAS